MKNITNYNLKESFWYSSEIFHGCNITSSYACDSQWSYIAVVVSQILLLPFVYCISKTIRERENKSIYRLNAIPSVGYCASFIVFFDICLFYFFVLYNERHEEIDDFFSNLCSISSDLYLLSLSFYFVHICKILNLMNSPLATFFGYASRILQYYFCASTIIKTFLVCIDLPEKWRTFFFSDEGFYYNKIIIPIEYVLNVISFLILSMMIIFSNFQSLFQGTRRKTLVTQLFLFAFAFNVALILRTLIYTKAITIIRLSDTLLYMKIFTVMFFMHRFIVDYVILTITMILSSKEKLDHTGTSLNMVLLI